MLTMSHRMGTHYHIFEEAVNISTMANEDVLFEFNGCNFIVNKNSKWGDEVCETILNNVSNAFRGDTYL